MTRIRRVEASRPAPAAGFLWAVVALLAPACGGDAPFEVRESVEQLHITHAAPGVTLELVGRNGQVLASGVADPLGSLIFRALAPGEDYAVRTVDGTGQVGNLSVMAIAGSTPDQKFYARQNLQPGFGYIETRDGTRLSIYVQLPGPVEDGPYPTVVNYSGYQPSRPGAPIDGVPAALCADLPVLCDAPNHPSGIIAGVLGFATVGVNMRGTGCSGGAYDFFEPLQLLDGYDVIETVAAQPWVLGNRVGMVGLSYPGISQLFVASTRPPSLAAITPLSVIADVQSVMYPGGILNEGFAVDWAEEVQDGAAPYGQGWERRQAGGGDDVCAENQLLHGQKVDLVQKAYDNPFYVPEIADPLNLDLLVRDIEVPVFLAGAWQDEQTGPGFASLLDKFDSSPQVRVQVYNGVHPDGFAPQIVGELNNFLSFHVAGRIPAISELVRSLAPLLYLEQFGAGLDLPPDRFAAMSDFAAARASYDSEDPVRIIFENGASATEQTGAPQGAWEATFPAWPPPGTSARRLYFHPDGVMRSTPPAADGGASKFIHFWLEGELQILYDDSIWDLLPSWHWPWHLQDQAVVFESEPLASDLVIAGFSSVDLWIQSTAGDADLEVTLTEVRPDDKEFYVQSGWLRASNRALANDASELRPTKTYLEADAKPLPSGQWELVRVELSAVAHAFRAGSQVRLSIDTPGGTRAEWLFALADYPDGTEISVAHSSAHPSSIALPAVPDLTIPTPPPPCPSLRGQPCRTHRFHSNLPAP